MLAKASGANVEFKSVAQSLIALFADSVDEHSENTPNAASNTQCTFSIRWKIVKLFVASMKNVQNAFSVKNRKIVPANLKHKFPQLDSHQCTLVVTMNSKCIKDELEHGVECGWNEMVMKF